MRYVGAMLLGAIVATIVITGVSWGAETMPSSELAGVDPPLGVDSIATRDTSRWYRIESDLARLTERVDALTRRVESSSPAPSPSQRQVVGEPTPRIDDQLVDVIIARIAETELEALSLDDLLERADDVSDTDFDAARKMIRMALQRPLTRGEIADVRTVLAQLLQSKGYLDEAAAILEDVIRSEGIDSEAGASASFCLIWVKSDAGEHLAARRIAQTIASSAVLGEVMRMNARYHAARQAFEAGERGQALAEAERLQQEFKSRAPELTRRREKLYWLKSRLPLLLRQIREEKKGR